jgi:hypothetical protein
MESLSGREVQSFVRSLSEPAHRGSAPLSSHLRRAENWLNWGGFRSFTGTRPAGEVAPIPDPQRD